MSDKLREAWQCAEFMMSERQKRMDMAAALVAVGEKLAAL